MKVLQVCYSDSNGGAAIAMNRLKNALDNASIQCDILRVHTRENEKGSIPAFGQTQHLFNRIVNSVLFRLFKRLKISTYPGPFSLNIMPTGLHRKINASDADIVHLHWINAEMISIREIAKIKKPVVWTLHDMWAICGMEHCSHHIYYKDGYDNIEQAGGLRSMILSRMDRWVWRRKMRAWETCKFQIVTPSSWLGNCVGESLLLGKNPINVIPNALDLNVFKPIPKLEARKRLGLPLDKSLVLYGAADFDAKHKGMDLLEEALCEVDQEVELVAFGGSIPMGDGYHQHPMGMVRDEEKMGLLYSAADVFVLPSRVDNLPNTAVESVACGTPVVAFRIGGVPDIVDHEWNGYLAEPFNPSDLARGINWILSRQSMISDSGSGDNPMCITYKQLCANARKKAEGCFAPDVVARQHIELFEKLLETV